MKHFNRLRSYFSREELKKLREKFHKKEGEEDHLTKKKKKKEIKKFRGKFNRKEVVYNHLKEKDTSRKKEENRIQKIVKYFKNLKVDLSKIKTYQYDTTHDTRYLFNEITKEDCYEPVESKSAFNGNYIEYESWGIIMIICR